MMWHFRTSHSSRRGFSVLEALVVLTILAAVMTIVVRSARGPSDQLMVQATAATIVEAAALRRREAVLRQTTTVFEPDVTSCAETDFPSIHFFADGSATGDDICIREGTERIWLDLDPLTGLLWQRE